MGDSETALSLRLYDILENVGASDAIRARRQKTAFTREIIHTVVQRACTIEDSHTSIYIFGSYSEGTTLESLKSDIDCVYCVDDTDVIDEQQNAPINEMFAYLAIRDKNTPPGYTKLQLMGLGIPIIIENLANVIEPYNEKTKFDWKGRCCIKHKSIVHINIFYKNLYSERHGPADTRYSRNSIEEDAVYALKSKLIPMFATEWLERQRRFGWPSYSDLRKMQEFGCFFVCIGHPLSQEDELEWRLSFSLQERVLMLSLNPTQYKCYILLKLLKKEVFNKHAQGCITSYICKTCVFYTIENTKPALWTPRNLMGCLRMCLVMLLQWISNANCPNYFVKNENMFMKPEQREYKTKLEECIQLVIADLPLVIYTFQCNHIGMLLRTGHVNCECECCCSTNVQLSLHNIQNVQSMDYIFTLGAIYCQNEAQAVYCLLNRLNIVSSVQDICGHRREEINDALSYVLPRFHLRIAQTIVSLLMRVSSIPETCKLFRLAAYHFQKGLESSPTTSTLLDATLLFRVKQYDTCANLLSTLENNLKESMISICRCNYELKVISREVRDNIERHYNPKRFLQSSVIECVKFLPTDVKLAPFPLHYEMFRSYGSPVAATPPQSFWFDCAVVDGKVYLHFLQYLVYSKMNDDTNKIAAIAKLISVMDNDLNIYHIETAFNLLGWIFVKEGQIKHAIRCFLTSWNLRPNHNASKFHIAQLLYVIQRSR